MTHRVGAHVAQHLLRQPKPLLNMLGNKISVAHLAEQVRAFDPGAIFTRSLSGLKGCEVVFGKEVDRLSPLLGWSVHLSAEEAARPVLIPEEDVSRLLVAVDSSSALIGRTSMGLLCVVRGAAAHACERARVCTVRYGPFFVHLDPAILDLIRESAVTRGGAFAVSESSLLLQMLRRRLEMMLWLAHSRSGDALVLVDGALPPALIANSMEGMLRMAQQEQLIGISKQTAMPEVGLAASALARSALAPAFLAVPSLSGSHGEALVKVGVVRFRAPGLVLRVDVPHLDSDRVLALLAQVNRNDLFTNGYPETLRTAHHACRFTGFEIEAMQIHAARSFDLRPVPTLDVRLAALGWW